MPRAATTTGEAIGQRRPFKHRRQEAVVALFVTADQVRRRYVDLFAVHGEITFQQYNVLRILRGAGPDGLATLAIAERMMERTPGITALLDRLESKGLVARAASPGDRRQILRQVTQRGLDVLAGLDPDMDRLDAQTLGCLSDANLDRMISLLDQVRAHNTDA